MRCPRCSYGIGFTATRCRVCGARVPRARVTFLAALSLAIGLGLGSAVFSLLVGGH